MLAPNNQDARPPASDDWFSYPPTIILDALYGNAALKRWATKSIMDIIANLTKDTNKQNWIKKQLMRKQTILLAK